MDKQVGMLEEAGVVVTLRIPITNWNHFAELTYVLRQIEEKIGIASVSATSSLVAELLMVPNMLARRLLNVALMLDDELPWDIHYNGELARVVSTFYKCRAEIKLI
jgi:hypothetical protein